MGAFKELAIEIEERGLSEVEGIRDYITGGHGTFTLLSSVTGTRFTYRIGTNDEHYPYFVGLLTGPDNTSGYAFTGTIFGTRDNLVYRPSQRSTVGAKSASGIALSWFLKTLNTGTLPDTVAFFHEGKCARCGRKLTTPESIKRGLGPHCANKGA